MTDGSFGFHAPSESLRILAEAIDIARQGEIVALALATESTTTEDG